MKELNIIIDAIPIGKGRPRVTTIGGFAHAYTPKKTKDAEAEYRQLIALQLPKGFKPFTGALMVEMVFGMPIPSSVSNKKRKAMIGKPHTGRIDIDNICKAVLDSVIEHKSKDPDKYVPPLLMIDDGQVCELTALKVYAEKPFIKIVVTDLGGGEDVTFLRGVLL